MAKLFSGNRTVRIVLTAIIAVAALNMGLVEFAEYDLLHDLLSLETGTTEYTAAIAAIAGSAAVTLYNQFVEVAG